ncbi:MAG: hypothetical protein GWP10_05280 [Nitrospiraceae bacterium]|nr:hypothetical protein [Nitrospiraceae bacterium]
MTILRSLSEYEAMDLNIIDLSPIPVFTSGYDPTTLMKRPVQSRMRGVVGAGGEKPLATRFGGDQRLRHAFPSHRQLVITPWGVTVKVVLHQ